jgi:hypothetical protein
VIDNNNKDNRKKTIGFRRDAGLLHVQTTRKKQTTIMSDDESFADDDDIMEKLTDDESFDDDDDDEEEDDDGEEEEQEDEEPEPANQSTPQTPSDDPNRPLTYEEERAQKIARNKRVLSDLGLCVGLGFLCLWRVCQCRLTAHTL